MKFTWLTDIHLDHLEKEQRKEFYESVQQHVGEFVLITGDIGNSIKTPEYIVEMVASILKPIYFVLGNHDFYGFDFHSFKFVEDIRKEYGGFPIELHETRDKGANANYLHGQSIIKGDVLIVGMDGWADCGYGSMEGYMYASINDHSHIRDFMFIEQCQLVLRAPGVLNKIIKNKTIEKRKELAQNDLKILNTQFKEFWEGAHILVNPPKKVLFLTHIPPFPENALYNGYPSSPEKLPFFTNKTFGDWLLKTATEMPDISFTVLCGHSHDKATFSPLPNLVVHTGEAQYGKPQIQELIEV